MKRRSKIAPLMSENDTPRTQLNMISPIESPRSITNEGTTKQELVVENTISPRGEGRILLSTQRSEEIINIPF